MEGSADVRRDVIAIGASAGGVSVLRRIASALPPNFSAAVLVVQHIGAHPSSLPSLLRAAGPNPALHGKDGQTVRPGTIYVAPPDRHMLVKDGRLQLTREAKENFARPAIDPMFRWVAVDYGARAIGVVLTGRLDDGAAGLRAIKDCGGLAVVQDPADAEEPQMPVSACAQAAVDHRVPADAVGPLLARLAGHPAPAGPAPPERLRSELRLSTHPGDAMATLDGIGSTSPFTCPECSGTLWRIRDSDPARFRCHTGHAYTQLALRHGQRVAADEALWSALRSLQEQQRLLLEIAESSRARTDPVHAAQLDEEVERIAEHREQLQRMLTDAPAAAHAE
jgi:two-component system chemotaxis response regulator CheB